METVKCVVLVASTLVSAVSATCACTRNVTGSTSSRRGVSVRRSCDFSDGRLGPQWTREERRRRSLRFSTLALPPTNIQTRGSEIEEIRASVPRFPFFPESRHHVLLCYREFRNLKKRVMTMFTSFARVLNELWTDMCVSCKRRELCTELWGL